MIARLMPTARATSSICASRTPRASNSSRVAAMICASRSRRRSAAPARRGRVTVGSVMRASYARATRSCTRCDHAHGGWGFSTRSGSDLSTGAEGADGVEGVDLGDRLVVAIAQDAGEAQGDAAGVARGALHSVERDLDDLLGPHLHDEVLASVNRRRGQLGEALCLPGEHLVGHPLERLPEHDEPTGTIRCAQVDVREPALTATAA